MQLEQLTKEELIALIYHKQRHSFLNISEHDMLYVRWDVLSNKALDLQEQSLKMREGITYSGNKKRWEEAEKIWQKAERLERQAQKVYEQLEEARR